MSLLLRIVAILQIAGGFYGLFSALPALLDGRASLALLAGMLLSGFALVAGVLLIEGHAQGERMSRIVQGLQVPLLATSWFSYAWHTGASVPLFLRFGRSVSADIDWSLPSQGLRLAAGGPATAVIGVNVLALVLWLVLWSRR